MQSIDKYELGECSISIAPKWGANMFSWIVKGRELMYCPPDYPEAAFKITGGGNPLLFPSLGRTWDLSGAKQVQGNYRIYGSDKTWFMPSHGVLFLSKLKKVDENRGTDYMAAAYEAEIPEEVKEKNYPFNVGFKQYYTLKSGSVELETVITNNDSVPAPVAFGYHPYFKVSNNQRDGIEVRIPFKRQLILDPDTVLPTGKTKEAENVMKLESDIYYDHAFDMPEGRRMLIVDKQAGRMIHVDYDEKFELFFVYSPDGSDFVCIEPWTRGLGAYWKMREPGWDDGKYIPVMQPGDTVHYKATYSVETCTLL